MIGFLRYLAVISEKFEPSFLFRPNLADENDNILIELAVVSQSRYLVTRNLRDFRSGELKFTSFKVITPADFMRIWRQDHVES